jgi:hypothetical protein
MGFISLKVFITVFDPEIFFWNPNVGPYNFGGRPPRIVGGFWGVCGGGGGGGWGGGGGGVGGGGGARGGCGGVKVK